MNTYFNLPSATDNNNNQQIYETDYSCENCRFTNEDSMQMITYPKLSMTQTTTSHNQQMYFEPYQSANHYLLSASNSFSTWKPTEPIVNNPIPSSTFSTSVANPILYRAHLWMRPGINRSSLAKGK